MTRTNIICVRYVYSIIGVRYFGVFQGYKQGVKFVYNIQSSGLISKISDLAAIAAYVIVGGFILLLVYMNIPITYTSGDTVYSIQETLNGLMFGILGLLYTELMYILITKKKISAVKLILITMVVGIVGAYLGILGWCSKSISSGYYMRRFCKSRTSFYRCKCYEYRNVEGQCVQISKLRRRIRSKIPVYADVYEIHGIPIGRKTQEN